MEIFFVFKSSYKDKVIRSRLHFGQCILTLVTNTDGKLQTERFRYQNYVSLICRNLYIEIIDRKAV